MTVADCSNGSELSQRRSGVLHHICYALLRVSICHHAYGRYVFSLDSPYWCAWLSVLSAIDRMERVISEMTCYISSWTLNSIHALGTAAVSVFCPSLQRTACNSTITVTYITFFVSLLTLDYSSTPHWCAFTPRSSSLVSTNRITANHGFSMSYQSQP